jgi:hypothetical protein
MSSPLFSAAYFSNFLWLTSIPSIQAKFRQKIGRLTCHHPFRIPQNAMAVFLGNARDSSLKLGGAEKTLSLVRCLFTSTRLSAILRGHWWIPTSEDWLFSIKISHLPDP